MRKPTEPFVLRWQMSGIVVLWSARVSTICFIECPEVIHDCNREHLFRHYAVARPCKHQHVHNIENKQDRFDALLKCAMLERYAVEVQAQDWD